MSVFLNGIRDSQVISATVPEKRFVSIALSDDSVTSSFWMFRTYDDCISPNRFSDSRVDIRLRDDEQVSLFRYNRDGSLSTQVLTSSELQEQYNTAKSLYAQSATQSDYMSDRSCCIKLDSDFAGRPYLSVSGNSFHSKFVDVVKLPCIIDNDTFDILDWGTTLVGSSPEESTFTDGSGASYRLHVLGCDGDFSSNRWLQFYCCPYDSETDTEGSFILINSERASTFDSWRDNIDDFVTLLNDYLGSYRSDINKKFSYGLKSFSMKILTDDDRVVDCHTYSSDLKEDRLFLIFDKSMPLDSFSNEGVKLEIIRGEACGNLSLTEAFRLNRAALDKINAIESLASDMELRSRVYDESSDSFAPEERSEDSLDWSLDVPETDPKYELFRQLKLYQETEHAYRELENARKAGIDADYTQALQSRDSESAFDIPSSIYRDVAESIVNGDVPEAAPIDDSWKNFAAHLGSVEPQSSGLSFLNGIKKSQITNSMGELVVEVALSDNNFWKFTVSPLQLYENHYVSDRMNVAVYSNSDVVLFRDFPNGYREEQTMSGAELKKQYDKARQDYFFAKLGEEEFTSFGEPINWKLQSTFASDTSRQNDDTGDFGE